MPYVPSAALIVRAPVRFDETLRYGEDVDLVWRLLDAGHRVVYDPSVVVRHHEADVLRRRFRYGTSAAPLAARKTLPAAPGTAAELTRTLLAPTTLEWTNG